MRGPAWPQQTCGLVVRPIELARTASTLRDGRPNPIGAAPVIVFLADLQNSYYRYLRNSVPIGMGYVRAYLHKLHGRAVEIRQFRKFEEMHEAAKSTTPHLIAFGSYTWNTLLTRKASRYFRERFPNAVIAVGGPDVSPVASRMRDDMIAMPWVDYFMPNEGETPMRHLVEAFLGSRGRDELLGRHVRGALRLDPDGALLGTAIDRFDADINEIPSPYFDGFMDRFLADGDYLPIVQTSRGCPYRCTFCVSGKDSWSKVKIFDIDRVKAEIDYLASKAEARYLRFADENFGIMPRDVEIAEYVVAKRRATGFPTSISIYTDKHPTDRVKRINETLKDCLPFCISFQSTDAGVLDNIKRINLKDKEIKDAVAFARAKDLMLVTELIFPLPGETVASFLAGLDRLIEYRFESVTINHLRLLKGTEMDLPAYRAKFGFVTKFHMSENGYTGHPDMECVEVNEAVMATNTITEDELHRVNRVVFLIDFGYHRSMFKELLFLMDAYGIKASEILMRCATDATVCPTLSAFASRYSEGVKAMFFDTPDRVVAFVRERMRQDPASLFSITDIKDALTIDILMSGGLPTVIGEVEAAALGLYRDRFGEVPASLGQELAVVRRLLLSAIIPLDKPAPIDDVIESHFDLPAWRAANYVGRLSKFRSDTPLRIGYRVPNPDLYRQFWSNDRATALEKYKVFFLTVNSANRRRVLATTAARAADPTTA